MNIRALLVPAFALFAIVGCGQKDPSSSAEPKDSGATASSSTTSASSSATAVRTIEISGNDQMKYSLNAIEAKPGEQLRVVLTNLGTLPKEAMAHNWVLLKAGSDAGAFSTAAATARDTNYIPASKTDEILAKIDLLGPRQSGEVTFKAPDQPGEYPFLCSFPAHFQVGMKGTLTVK
jgi:azurin